MDKNKMIQDLIFQLTGAISQMKEPKDWQELQLSKEECEYLLTLINLDNE